MRDTLYLIHTLSEVPVTATPQVIKEVPAVENAWKKIFIEALYTIKPHNDDARAILVSCLFSVAAYMDTSGLGLLFIIFSYIVLYLNANSKKSESKPK